MHMHQACGVTGVRVRPLEGRVTEEWETGFIFIFYILYFYSEIGGEGRGRGGERREGSGLGTG